MWDGHLKYVEGEFEGVAFKNLPEPKRKEIKKECLTYIVFVEDTVNIRKRKPYKSSTPFTPFTQLNQFNSNEQQTENEQIPIQKEKEEKEQEFITIEKINEQIKRLNVFGEIFSEYGFYQRSDERSKHDITLIHESLNEINKIQGYSYRYKNEEQKIKY